MEQFVAIVGKLGLDRSTITDPVMLSTLEKWGVGDRNGNWTLSDQPVSELEWDFIRKMVAFEPGKRANCRELLQHAYFQ